MIKKYITSQSELWKRSFGARGVFFSNDDEFRPPVSGPSPFVMVGINGTLGAVAYGKKLIRRNPEADQVSFCAASPLGTQRQVVRACPALITMPLNLHKNGRVGDQPPGLAAEALLHRRQQSCLIQFEVHGLSPE